MKETESVEHSNIFLTLYELWNDVLPDSPSVVYLEPVCCYDDNFQKKLTDYLVTKRNQNG